MDTSENPYLPFLNTVTKSQWERIGLKRRAGVATPLFSIYSKRSIGIGEYPDLKLLSDWCKKTSMSIIQLLPMNDVGFDFRPYDAQSAFALEPVYLSIEKLKSVSTWKFRSDIQKIKNDFPCGNGRVHYGVKKAKLELLFKIFETASKTSAREFDTFKKENTFWLDDYAFFKVIKSKNGEKGWEEWPAALKSKDPTLCTQLSTDWVHEIEFQKWLQWQCFEQFKSAKRDAEKNGVLIMGDIPFLVSRDSADVWSHQNYFKLDLVSGAPPDAFFAHGQRWGMPPYNWEAIAANGYDYLVQKLKYAQNFYDIFRIDHAVGIFRLWSIPRSDPQENGGSNGVFDPADQNYWEEHGRKHISAMIQNTNMLPCAEDLGVVPDCTFKVLKEFGIPGMDIERWKRNWDSDYEFSEPEKYRPNSIAVVSTHDMSSLAGWWEFEAETIDEAMFKRKCEEAHISFEEIKIKLFDLENSLHGRLRWRKEIANKNVLIQILGKPENEIKELTDLYLGSYDEKRKFWSYLGLTDDIPKQSTRHLVGATLAKVSHTVSIFSIQLLQDWLSLSDTFHCDAWNYRINFPGTMDDTNWSITIPFPLENLLRLDANSAIQDINKSASRS